MPNPRVLALIALMLIVSPPPASAWRTSLSEPGTNGASALAVDEHGNPVAAGFMAADDEVVGKFVVVKLAAGDGTSLWRYAIDDVGSNRAAAVAVDARGDVIAAGQTGFMDLDEPVGSLTVVKLAGPTGAELWRYDTDGALLTRALAVDPHGDGS